MYLKNRKGESLIEKDVQNDLETNPSLEQIENQLRTRRKRIIAAIIVAVAAVVGVSIYVIVKLLQSKNDDDKLLNFLLGAINSVYDENNKENVPTSFYVQRNYWEYICTDFNCSSESPESLDLLTERILSTVGTNLYDAATWQIALSLNGLADIAEHQTKLIASDHTADANPYSTLRATSNPEKTPQETFTYGNKQLYITNSSQAYLFRMIGPAFWNKDPLAGWKDIPENNGQNWVDWKPITGENAWALLIGPMQKIYLQNNKNLKNISVDCMEIQMARNALTAFQAMQSPIGAIYYTTTDVAPNQGAGEVNPYTVSLENNFSTLSGLNMLKTILEAHADEFYADGAAVATDIAQIETIIEGILSFVVNYAYDAENGYFYQGGEANNPERQQSWVPVIEPFAVDVQTWGATVLGQPFIDEHFGEGAAFQLWNIVKEKGGYFADGDTNTPVLGVGYTYEDCHCIISSEWTFGAINMVKCLAKQYAEIGKKEYVKTLDADAKSMSEGVQILRSDKFKSEDTPASALTKLPKDQVGFLYANKRYKIPFGWFANPLPSACSTAWAILWEENYNAFVLGGHKEAIKWTLSNAEQDYETFTSSAESLYSGNFVSNSIIMPLACIASQSMNFLHQLVLDSKPSDNVQFQNIAIPAVLTTIGFFGAYFFNAKDNSKKKASIYEQKLISRQLTLGKELILLKDQLDNYLQNGSVKTLSPSKQQIVRDLIILLEDSIEDVNRFSLGKTTREDIKDILYSKKYAKEKMVDIAYWINEQECKLDLMV